MVVGEFDPRGKAHTCDAKYSDRTSTPWTHHKGDRHPKDNLTRSMARDYIGPKKDAKKNGAGGQFSWQGGDNIMADYYVPRVSQAGASHQGVVLVAESGYRKWSGVGQRWSGRFSTTSDTFQGDTEAEIQRLRSPTNRGSTAINVESHSEFPTIAGSDRRRSSHRVSRTMNMQALFWKNKVDLDFDFAQKV